MEWVKNSVDYNVPIKSWCKDVEEGALLQAENLARHPVIFHHVALMPDCHQGYGMPIGGVIACNGAVIPNAVGVDIGCGMAVVETKFNAKDLDAEIIKRIIGAIRKVVPVGFSHHSKTQDWHGFNDAPKILVVQRELESARKQIGTLGGGNHFIELQKDESDLLWIMVHSGSRNFGYKIAKAYNDIAIKLCDMWKLDVVKDLAFLPIDTIEGQEYYKSMEYALKFASANRNRIIDAAMDVVSCVLGCKFKSIIDVHHNFVAIENHFGKNIYVHRKGATMARGGQLGIIPGSMGTSSYIVAGLGNPDSFSSCSHGAGRRMGRANASRSLTVEECDKAMEGIVFGRWGQDRKGRIDLGEAPQVYKDIDSVIEAQADLVTPLVKLTPLGVIKG